MTSLFQIAHIQKKIGNHVPLGSLDSIYSDDEAAQDEERMAQDNEEENFDMESFIWLLVINNLRACG